MIGNRNKYDDVLQPVVIGDSLFFGSSIDNNLHCLDLKTGAKRWSYAVGGLLRLAPTVSNGKVAFGADDGYSHCISATDGSLVWKVCGSNSENNWLLARGEMISRWPIRTGVTVEDGRAYFGAGIFPHESGPIVFDVLMQGKVLFESVTLNPPAGEELEVVTKEVPSVAVNDNLIIDCKAKVGRCFVRILSERSTKMRRMASAAAPKNVHNYPSIMPSPRSPTSDRRREPTP